MNVGDLVSEFITIKNSRIFDFIYYILSTFNKIFNLFFISNFSKRLNFISNTSSNIADNPYDIFHKIDSTA